MENNTTKILQNNLILLRRNARLTQEQFADQLGLSFQAVSKWENGLSCPDIALLPEIAKIYGISVDQLFTPLNLEELSQPGTNLENSETPWEQKVRETEAQENSWEQKAREVEASEDSWEQKAQEVEAQENLWEQKVPVEEASSEQPSFNPFASGDFGASLGQYVSRIVEQAMENASVKLQKESLGKDFHFDFDFNKKSHPKFEKASGIQVDGLPWEDDGIYRAVLFRGKKLVTPPVENGGTLAVDELEGDLLSAFSVTCDDIEGDVRCVLGNLTCDEISGDAVSCGTVNCDEVCGDAVQCGTVNCDEICGDIIQCGTIDKRD